MADDPLTRTNTIIRLTPCRNGDKTDLLASRLGDAADGAELFRVRTADAGAGLLKLLRRHGRNARLLLPNQSNPEIAQTEAWFASADCPSLIVAEPMPLPRLRQDVRSLFLMNLPPNLRAAYDDIAAAGNDGLDSAAEVFASRQDHARRFDLFEQHFTSAQLLEKVHELNECVSWIEHDGCARVFLARRLFGKKANICGNCGWCLGRRLGFLPQD